MAAVVVVPAWPLTARSLPAVQVPPDATEWDFTAEDFDAFQQRTHDTRARGEVA